MKRRALVIVGLISLNIGVIARPALSQTGGPCAQCVPDFNQNSYGCLSDQYIGWTSCVPGPTCDHGAECNTGYTGGCFLAGTLVATPHGETPIEALRVGDQIVSETPAGKRVQARVARTYHVIQTEYYVINGRISVTGTHPFYVNGQWVPVSKLAVGDVMSGEAGGPVVIDSIEKADFGVRVYNIAVDGPHTFFADGILVHNKGPDPTG